MIQSTKVVESCSEIPENEFSVSTWEVPNLGHWSQNEPLGHPIIERAAILCRPALRKSSMAIDQAAPLPGVRKTTAKSSKQLRSENYRRQKQTLYTKLEKMHVQFAANMCLLLERNGKFEIFTSHGQMLSMLGLNEAKVSYSIRPV
jgi:hypothetical protein